MNQAGDEYFIAARNKIRLARFHLDSLVEELQGPKSDPPPTGVQAHFEGILYCFDAAADQLAEGINRSYGLTLDQPAPWDVIRDDRVPIEVRQALRQWLSAPIARTARHIRNLATHQYTRKTAEGPTYRLHLPAEASVPADLLDFSRLAVKHLDGLTGILKMLRVS